MKPSSDHGACVTLADCQIMAFGLQEDQGTQSGISRRNSRVRRKQHATLPTRPTTANSPLPYRRKDFPWASLSR